MFRRKKKQVEVSLDADWLTIDAIGFFGRWTRSPNERWLLAHGQIDDPNAESWSSDDSTGAVLLFDGGKQVARIDGLTRPETVAVSDSGVFAVYEWGKAGDFLGDLCQLRVFTSSGDLLFRQQPGAAVERLALTRDGRFLAFHTLNEPPESKRPDDGASIFVVDLSGPAFVWQAPVPMVWPSGISFAPDDRSLHVTWEGRVFEYSPEGVLANPGEIGEAKLAQARAHKYGYSLWEIASERLGEVESGVRDVAERPAILGLLREALGKEMSPNTKARIHRSFGEAAEAAGNIGEAVREYRKALEFNPKVGVKRKLQKLEEG